MKTIEASSGLRLEWSDSAGRIAWGPGRDWLGPLSLRVLGPGGESHGRTRELREADGRDALGDFHSLELDWDEPSLPVRTQVRAYRERPLVVFRLEASKALSGLGTGRFDEPSFAWPCFLPAQRAPGGLPAGARAAGHQYTEFALPTWSDADLAGFFLLPQRPAVLAPLWLVADSEHCLMLAPLDAFHEQVIAVPRNREQASVGVRCGWHGDLASAPAGFASELALWAGSGPRAVLEEWAGELRARHGTRRPSRYADAGVAKLSYWTDNGAAYWYRSEPGCDVPATLERAASELRRQQIPFHAFQLDSWWYPHEQTRPFDGAGGGEVPPTGMLRWEPRDDVLPSGLGDLRRRLGEPPLILHSRHFSSRSPYFADGNAWLDGARAHPSGPELFDRLLAQAADWGAVTYEQDWLVESFLGVRGLREAPGRARDWQRALDRAAGEHGLTLQWCMGTPADFFQTLELERVSSIRTCGDYRYMVGNGALWVWFLHTNALARALGLWPFKDVFVSSRTAAGRDGDPCAEAEALLAALSAGPVGLGDRAGTSERELVLRTCRNDGLLVKPDVPIAALERGWSQSAFTRPVPLLGETYSAHPAGRWIYLVALNAYRGEERLSFRVELAELGAERPRSALLRYDWRAQCFERLEPDCSFELSLDPLDWHLSVLCPLLPGGLAVFGDVSKYATAGDRRIARIRSLSDGVAFDVLGARGERVQIRGWSERPLAAVEGATLDYADASDGRWCVSAEVGATGRVPVKLALR